jgi:hypothetical protein
MTKAFFHRIAKTVGGLSKPSKMPCHSFSIPATACRVGSNLRKVAGSVCAKCYARKGRYVFPNVVAAMTRRLEALGHPEWVERMTQAINGLEAGGFFRWHDSGDLQDREHLARIVEVARRTPTVRHWLPTKEYGLVHGAIRDGLEVPGNLTIRVSAPMVGAAAPDIAGLPTSTVVRDSAAATCRAFERKGVCGPCRACWDPAVRNVAYAAH